MRIAVIRQQCAFDKGGAERYCASLCRALAEGGHEVFVLAERLAPDVHPTLRHVPIRMARWSSSVKNRSFHEGCQAALTNLQVDRVYALARTYPVDALRVSDPLHAAWMQMRYRHRWRYWLERLNPRHRTLLGLEKALFTPTNTKAVITNSRLARAQVHHFYRYPLERIHVVYNGVDLQQFTPPADPKTFSRRLRLLFVAMDFKRKGLYQLVRALALLVQRGVDCSLHIAGRGPEKVYQRLAADLGVIDRVRFYGAVRRIEALYRTADLLVCPTRYDPFANVCLEALACGLPVVTTTANGAAEILTEGQTGYILKEALNLPEQIAAAVAEHAALASQERQRWSQQARCQAERFSIAQNAAATLTLLESL